MPTIDAPALLRFSTDLLTAGGFSPSDAAETAELLVWANLRGVDSHGVLRLPRYLEWIETGVLRSGHEVAVVRDFGAVTLLDGGRCSGAVGMNRAVKHAARKAESHGIGWCAARAISHAGAVGYFTQALARRGLVGMAMTASKPLMSYPGAKGEVVSTNPLSIAFPTAGTPVILDMSTAAVALGKIMAAKDRDEAIPEGWGVDAGGQPTTDPHKVAAVVPMAGPKGAGLSLMIEMLTSVLAGNAVIGPVLTGTKKGGFNGTVIAVNPEAFGPRATFDMEVARLVDAIHGLEPAQADHPVRLPGEGGDATEAIRQAEGIPLPAGTVQRLVAIAGDLGVAVPDALST